jgi:uncharacterized protein
MVVRTVMETSIMTPEERQLISGLFDRMRSLPPQDKDADAEQLIRDGVRRFPDSPYMLVQSVLIQEQALQQADERIRDLEDQVASFQAQGQRATGTSGGSFLNRTFGRGSAASSSVPAFGAARRPVAVAASPWGNAPAAPVAAPAPRSGGGFLASALSTAAGVTGGMLLADSIRGMMSGDRGDQTALTRARDAAQDARQDADDARTQLTESDVVSDETQDAVTNTDFGGDDGGSFDV